MVRLFRLVVHTWMVVLLCQHSVSAVETPSSVPRWHSDYWTAWQEAKDAKKMLLILYYESYDPSPQVQAAEDAISASPKVIEGDFVLARLPLNAAIMVDGRWSKLVDHGAMQEMHGAEGVAIIDLAHPNPSYYGRVVSAFPFIHGKYYRFQTEYVPVILDLPPGTITERTMIWAVRVHPEHPASTRGTKDMVLVKAAKRQSELQAQIGVQGHHRWESRFHILRRLLGERHTPVEVVAESWPDQTMIDSCIDCVASWRYSSGHWNAVKSHHPLYGYDIKRGQNGIWYGTGIFAN